MDPQLRDSARGMTAQPEAFIRVHPPIRRMEDGRPVLALSVLDQRYDKLMSRYDKLMMCAVLYVSSEQVQIVYIGSHAQTKNILHTASVFSPGDSLERRV